MTFLISWRGVVSFVVFLVLKSGFYVPNHFFLNDLVWVWARGNFKRKWVMKLPIMIYHVPTKNKIFLSKGVLSPCNLRQEASSLDPCEHLAHRVSFPQFKIQWRPCISGTQRGRGFWVGAAAPPIFWWQSGEMSRSGEFTIGHGGSMESLVEMVQIENLLQSYVNFTLGGNRFSCPFKVLKPTSFRGLCILDPDRDVPQTPQGALKNFWSC